MADLTLGDLTFDSSYSTFDLPDKITWGGAQRLGIHQLPGGVRIVDAMGADDMDLSWSGMFFGPSAVEKGQQLDRMRRKGAPVTLSWDSFSYSVVVEKFEGDFERHYQVPYRVSCKVIDDLTNPATAPSFSTNDYVNADWANGVSSASNLGMTVPSGGVTPFSSTLGATSSGGTAITAGISSGGLSDGGDPANNPFGFANLQAAGVIPADATYVSGPP